MFKFSEWRSPFLKQNTAELFKDRVEEELRPPTDVSKQLAKPPTPPSPPSTVPPIGGCLDGQVQTELTGLDIEDTLIKLLEAEHKLARINASKPKSTKLQISIKIERCVFETSDIASLVNSVVWTEVKIEAQRPLAAGRTHATERKGNQVKWNDTLRIMLPSHYETVIPLRMTLSIWTVVSAEDPRPVLIAQCDTLVETSKYGKELIFEPPTIRLFIGAIDASLLGGDH